MDTSTIEHSDSDSGESWTLLENTPKYGDDAPHIPNNISSSERECTDIHSEKDEDTDGISIISDSEPESTPCEDLKYVKVSQENVPAEEQNSPLLATTTPININDNSESVRDETDFLGDNVKYKTYVHRRNPKVGTILDIIMLGTFVITAGMALGHLWSCKNECTNQTSVNKILSNLYKLQEENAYLRNKLKEITDTANYQLVPQRKSTNNKLATKQYRCKKIFEEPVIKNNKVEMAVKCVDDNKPAILHNDPLAMPEYEKELLNDIDKMKNIYDQNKEWLDIEVKKQFEVFEKLKTYGLRPDQNRQLDSKNQLGPTLIKQNSEKPDVSQDTKAETLAVKSHRQINLEKQLGPTYFEMPLNTNTNIIKKDSKTECSDAIKSHREANSRLPLETNPHRNPSNLDVQTDPLELVSEKKITYADSLKLDQPLQKSQRIENNDKLSKWTKDHSSKRKHKEDVALLNLSSVSEEDIKKDDRYKGPRVKNEKKKHDRQKSHKKQKRNNKYEQWEMKGGYLRDFDEFSVASSQDNEILVNNNPDKMFLNSDFENYINKLIEIENSAPIKQLSKTGDKIIEKPNLEKHSLKSERKKRNAKDSEWYDQRSALRAEARMKLEHELFGENTSNNAAWYFRRMQKREQCRAQRNNSTFKKFSKKKMNFKMKR